MRGGGDLPLPAPPGSAATRARALVPLFCVAVASIRIEIKREESTRVPFAPLAVERVNVSVTRPKRDDIMPAWTNWSGSVQCAPTAIIEPQSESELIDCPTRGKHILVNPPRLSKSSGWRRNIGKRPICCCNSDGAEIRYHGLHAGCRPSTRLNFI